MSVRHNTGIYKLKLSLISDEKAITKSKTPKGLDGIAGVALLLESGGSVPKNIKVSKKALDIVSKIMPYGVGPENKVYFKLIKLADTYHLWVYYLDSPKRVKIGEYTQKPKWAT